MLDVIICHHDKCEKCDHECECVCVVFWDKSFTGLLCWLDLMKMVREKSQDPEARKKFAELRPQRSVTHSFGEGFSTVEGGHHTTHHSNSRTWSFTETESNSEPSPFAD